MDPLLSLPSQRPTTASQETSSPVAAEEEPDSPGRSPRSSALPADAAATDPVAEGLALMAGVSIALLSLLVPLACVIGDRTVPELAGATRIDR